MRSEGRKGEGPERQGEAGRGKRTQWTGLGGPGRTVLSSSRSGPLTARPLSEGLWGGRRKREHSSEVLREVVGNLLLTPVFSPPARLLGSRASAAATGSLPFSFTDLSQFRVNSLPN